ncbi:MAG: nuclear transport factor 2 family protein [Candidatus Andeanibacterium colombiense]|uniref:Nuclear transport factor 2 family protein n=1 Tax=Candidatus Andeanibacterium colombiense TaxID=3121345 RepID=A0AAJ6BLU2_9SPHN|nr:MAG: nuclear transport factor 2 family protein [Sphingomonadaceae bacterium]
MMDDLARLLAEREIALLPLLFAKYADNGDHAALAALFTEDCSFARPFQPDHPFHGRDRVQAIFRDRPPILVRHIVTNVLVELVSDTAAKGTNYLAMLSSHASVEPPQEAGALYVGGFEDEYAKTADGWKFAKRAGRVVLHQGGAMPNIPPPSDEARGIK